MPLLTFADARRFPRPLLDTPGAFLWWYAELFDQEGNGLVLIWSFGLPFLPGLASNARKGVLTAPARRPSINVAVYRRWVLDCYLLQEYSPDDVHWTDQQGVQRWAFQSTTLELRDGELRASLDLPILDHDVLRGEVAIHGKPARLADATPRARESHHVWAPQVVAAQGEATLNVGSGQYRLRGRAYVDGNYGDRPLGESLDHWSWGRIAHGEEDLLYYLLTRGEHSEAYLVKIRSSGEVVGERATVEQRTRRGRFGLRHPARLRVSSASQAVELDAGSRLDDGPFYARYQLRDAAGRPGVGEHCDVRRIDLARHRPLVRMRVVAPTDNSMWLPLFCGPRRDRVLNLLTHWAML